MKPHIEKLEDAINTFIKDMKDDSRLKDVIELSIISFSDDVESICDWCSISKVEPNIKLSSKNLTYFVPAIDDAINLVKLRTKVIKEITKLRPYKPWIFFMTDGLAMDEESELNRISELLKEMETSEKLHFVAIGVGENFDKDQLIRLNPLYALQLKNHAFKELFSYIGVSLAAVSSGNPDDDVEISSPTNNVKLLHFKA